MAWTKAQQIVLAMTPKASSVLSLFGSGWTVVEVLTHNKGKNPKRRLPYHRLLLAMSIYDILESVWNFASTWPIPEETEDVHNPVGTTRTCTAQGFFLTLGVAVPIYNAMLSLYYLLVIRYRYTEATLKQRIEPMMHIVAFVFAFGTATTASFMGLMNNANLWCWIALYPGDCLDSRRYPDDADCERGDNAWIYRWAFYFAPLWFCILFATVCTLMVYQYVLSIEHRTVQYRRPQNALRASFETATALFRGPRGKSRPEQREDERSDVRETHTRGVGVSVNTPKPRSRPTRRAADYRHTVEVFRQSLWYLGSFYITHVWSTSNRIIQQLNNGKTIFAVIVLHAWFDPLQGFLNFLVYQRPRYFKVRKDSPEKGRLGAIAIVLRFSFLSEIDFTIRSFQTPTPTRSQDTGKSGVDSLSSGKADPALEITSDIQCSFSDHSEDSSVASADCYRMFSSQVSDEGSTTEDRDLSLIPRMELSGSDIDPLDSVPLSDESDHSFASGSTESSVLQPSPPGEGDDKLGGPDALNTVREKHAEQAPTEIRDDFVGCVRANSSDKKKQSTTGESTCPPVGAENEHSQDEAHDGDQGASQAMKIVSEPQTLSSSDWYLRFL